MTHPDSPDFVPGPERVAVFDNDGTLWTEQPVYAQLVFALDWAAQLGHPTSLGETEFRIGPAGPDTDGEREYAYDHDPILGSGTDGVRAAATEQKWTVIDMAADWSVVHPPAV